MELQTELRFEIAEISVSSHVEMVLALLSDRNWWSPVELCDAVWRTRGIRMSDAGCTQSGLRQPHNSHPQACWLARV